MLQNEFSINKLSQKSKKTFRTRTIFGILVVLFFLVAITFVIVADIKWPWIQTSLTIKRIFAFFLLIWFLPIVYLSAIEIRNIHFDGNKVSLLLILFSIILITYGPTLVYFLNFYKFVYVNPEDLVLWFLLSTIIAIIIVAFINAMYLWTQGLINIKQIFIHCILIYLIAGLLLAFFFFSFTRGWTTILLLYLITVFSDTCAYLIGMLFGKKKIFPYISPNKTLAGVLGGVLLSTLLCIVLMIAFSYIPNEYNVLGNFFGVKFQYTNDFINNNNNFAKFPAWWGCVVVFFFVLSFLSIMGDLSFSYIKRSYQIKDFSNLIPGHGGLLDRIDSLSFVFCSYIIFTVIISLFSSTSPLL